MRSTDDRHDICLACRGHGWKFHRSRRAWTVGTLTRGQAECTRRSCVECQGSGHVRKPDRPVAAGDDDTPPAHGQDAGGAVQAHWFDWGLALDSRSLLRGKQAAPPWMRAELLRLQAAFPEFSFGICPGWRGPAFEVWRETGTGDLYAMITQDARELWRELEASQADQRAAADAAGHEPR